MNKILYKIHAEGQRLNLQLTGRWRLVGLAKIETKLVRDVKQAFHKFGPDCEFYIDGSGLDSVDTSGVYLIMKIQQLAKQYFGKIQAYQNMPREFESLSIKLKNFDFKQHHIAVPSILMQIMEVFGNLGKAVTGTLNSIGEIFLLLGMFMVGFWDMITRPWQFRYTSMIHHLQNMTIPALVIVAAVSFMVGAVLTEQAAVRLPGFGAEELVVSFIGMTTTRETSILLTGMLVAGRSSSSITAEIGSMRMNEEIDAMKVIGLDVMRFLVMPRAMAMLIALPILTFVAIVAGLVGSAVLLNLRYGMSINVFIERIYTGLEISDIGTALIKTPFIAVALVMVACYEGMKVRSSASSLGYHTTVSVVKGLFLVIIIDSVIAIYFTQLNRLG